MVHRSLPGHSYKRCFFGGYIISYVIAAFLITTSICFHIAQTISSPFKVPGTLGEVIVCATHSLVVEPYCYYYTSQSWMLIVFGITQ